MTKFYDDATVDHVASAIHGGVAARYNIPGGWDAVPPPGRYLYRIDARAALDALATAPGWRIQYAVSLTDTPEPYLTHNREDAEVLRGDMETKGIIDRLVGPWVEVGDDD